MGMKELNLARTLGEKRRKKGVTQEELAVYLGVSKASVSKWETGQSYPDILFLPQLATYFNITVDELLGYEPQMTKEDIRRLYHRLAGCFAEKPYSQVMEECEEIVKRYYSCFPLLIQMAALLLNHCDLAAQGKDREVLMEYIVGLCVRVREESGDVNLMRTANFLESAARLGLEQYAEVVALLEKGNRSPDLGEETLYATALQLQGNLPKAREVLQISLYRHLMALLGTLPNYLMVLLPEPERFREGLLRAQELCRLFRMEGLHPYFAAQVEYVGAHGCLTLGDAEQALAHLQEYARLCGIIFPASLHGDEFFDLVEPWIAEFELGPQAPKDDKHFRRGMADAVVENPEFACLDKDPRYRSVVERLKQYL